MYLRFFYPEPDLLTVYGPENATYWFMLFVRLEAFSHFKVIYYLATFTEIIALLAGSVLHIRGFARFWKLRAVHINCLLLIGQMYATAFLGFFSRLCLIPYESGILRISGLETEPTPFLAILRQASYADVFYVLFVVTIERTCATVYVADYEKKPRLFISFLLIALIIIASYGTGYAIVKGIVSAFFVSAVIQMSNICCSLWFRWLIRYNKKRLARLTDRLRQHPDNYSLSLRLQLKENIWSMKKIELGVYLIVVGISLNIVLVFGPILILTSPEQFETLQWFSCAGNLAYALTALCTSPWLEVAIAMHTGRVPPALRVLLGTNYFSKKAPLPKSECDSYFGQLESQWSTVLQMRDSRGISR
ncbi:hypothetical protein PMAYCL1PPCAC_15788 [Pristionchus mayeri]|uniref:G protein-coupled receptor n=1 Tax=Pristionchus mayeri TaxID=1317129 RepID=A0AAN5CJM7_9BILA|nr:hypothetical protein PMAYCL1PPCAC_15788 [Pristionchus mayeri]